MTSLPVVSTQGGDLAVIDEQGELVPLREATDHLLLRTVTKLMDAQTNLTAAKRALAFEMRDRHGVGTAHTPAGDFRVTEEQRWPDKATDEALKTLLRRGSITEADYDRAMPLKRKPDATQCNALLRRLLSDPEAARILAGARSASPPSVRDVQMGAVDGSAT